MARRVLLGAVLVGIWMIEVGQRSLQELIAAVIVATIAVAIVDRIRVRRGAQVRIRPRWLRHVWRLPVQIAGDLWLLTRHLFDRRPGEFRVVPYPQFAGDDEEAAGRRAVMTAAASLGPNTVVIGWDAEHGDVVVHQLVRSPHVLPVPGGDRP